jgi:hypothetical protein
MHWAIIWMRSPCASDREDNGVTAARFRNGLTGVLLGGAGLVLLVANLYYGELNQDEGWYLLAARAVAAGEQPYADFAFTQGPVFPAVYALIQPLVAAWGLSAARLFTALLGAVAVVLAGVLAARLSPREWAGTAAFMTIALLWVNVYHSYFSLVVKTYSLTALLLVGGALCIASVQPGRRGAPLVAGLLLALAAGVRLSVGVWLPVVGLYWLLQRRKWPGAWLYFGIGGGAGLLLAFGPALIRAPDAMWFWLIEYHAARASGSWAGALVLKAGFISRFVQAYYLPLGLGVLTCIGAATSGSFRSLFRSPAGLLWTATLALTFLHVAAPFPYEDYQVLLMPVWVALTVAGLTGWLSGVVPAVRQEVWRPAMAGMVLVLAIGAAFSSPLNQRWLLLERDRIWWPLKEQSDLGALQEAGRWLRAQAGPDARLFTQDAYLAIEAGLAVPAGLEMGPFSYYPEWSLAQAGARHVLNRERLLALLDAGTAEWAAVSGYGLAIASPGITPLPPEEAALLRERLEQRYERVRVFPHFGQAYTELEIFRRRRAARAEE